MLIPKETLDKWIEDYAEKHNPHEILAFHDGIKKVLNYISEHQIKERLFTKLIDELNALDEVKLLITDENSLYDVVKSETTIETDSFIFCIKIMAIRHFEMVGDGIDNPIETIYGNIIWHTFECRNMHDRVKDELFELNPFQLSEVERIVKEKAVFCN